MDWSGEDSGQPANCSDFHRHPLTTEKSDCPLDSCYWPYFVPVARLLESEREEVMGRR